MLDLYGIGDHGGGPHHSVPSSTKASTGRGPNHVTPTYQFGTAQSFFSSVEKQIAPESPTWDYQSIAKGYTRASARTQPSLYSHMEGGELYFPNTIAAS